MSEPRFRVEEAAARFFPSGINQYDRAMGKRLIAWLSECGYVLARADGADARQGQKLAGSASAEGIDLIALAAWLRRQALQADAASAPDSAARLARASDIVKEAADRQRHERVETHRPIAANRA